VLRLPDQWIQELAGIVFFPPFDLAVLVLLAHLSLIPAGQPGAVVGEPLSTEAAALRVPVLAQGPRQVALSLRLVVRLGLLAPAPVLPALRFQARINLHVEQRVLLLGVLLD
jgi:hypothetical protein